MPLFVPNDPETISRLYPLHLNLKFVQIFHRHGERTPVRRRLEKFIPPVWNLCKAVQQFHVSVLLLDEKSSNPRAPSEQAEKESTSPLYLQNYSHRRVLETDSPARNSFVTSGACLHGELTDIGRRTISELGANLRELYVDKIKFLDPKIENDKAFYLRTTNFSRTKESLHQLFVGGLYPPAFRNNSFTPNIRVRNSSDDSLHPDPSCKRLHELLGQFALQTETQYEEKLNSLSEQLKPHVKEVRIESHPSSLGIYDTASAAKYNGLPLPKEFTPQVMRDLEEVSVAESFGGYKQSYELLRLGVGRLMSELKDQMLSKVEEKPESRDLKFAIYSGHDSTIATILLALQAFDDRWPVFSSHITFELFEDTSQSSRWTKASSKNHYVRVKYNDKVLELAECQRKNKHHKDDKSLCTFDAFLKIVENFVPENYTEECSTQEQRSDPIIK